MTQSAYEQYLQTTPLSGQSISYVDSLYEAYLIDRSSVSEKWSKLFDSFPRVDTTADEISHAQVMRQVQACIKNKSSRRVGADDSGVVAQMQVDNMINHYRRYGHTIADMNPLYAVRNDVSGFAPEKFGLHAGLSTQLCFDSHMDHAYQGSLSDIIARCRSCYCSHIGYEFMHLDSERERQWWQVQVEQKDYSLTAVEKQNILQVLISAEGMEKFLAIQYVGQKRFGLDGGESLIAQLDAMIACGVHDDLREVVISMAHRGRLNVMLNIMGMSAKELFAKFSGAAGMGNTSGDVKYHLGYSSDRVIEGQPIHLSLCFNPSHLEAVYPVGLGSCRSRLDLLQKNDMRSVLPIAIHGDSAFTGQGIVLETLNMSQTHGYSVGGCIHIVVNNQIGFTTDDPKDARTGYYCSDPAKMIAAPILHVNGDDPEACVRAAKLAYAYRNTFHKDVVIDLVCYRRAGHNESDEPAATQPLMYKQIRSHPSVKTQYAQKLLDTGIMTEETLHRREEDVRGKLSRGDHLVQVAEGVESPYAKRWKVYNEHADIPLEESHKVKTQLPLKVLCELGDSLNVLPEHFVLQRQVGQVIAQQREMFIQKRPLNWGAAEILAYASLLHDKYGVRILGQDVCRGTFAHRHAMLHDQEKGERFSRLDALAKAHQVKFEIHNSVLSEFAALGFEYGYSITNPKTLVIWEAQFGDFANGAQVIIDQFISSGWQKWERLSGLVMLLPHGYEGMGPEHSSARLERYLQLCAQNNMQVCVPTTPAQMYHLLRRQMHAKTRTPLIVMTPKSLLRNPMATSSMDDLATGCFERLLLDSEQHQPSKIKRVVLCCGKVYYDLYKKREEMAVDSVALIRVEQLYPFPYAQMKEILAGYSAHVEIVWCQEEPKNQGAWFVMRDRLQDCIEASQSVNYIGRSVSAAPACGYLALHEQEQKSIVLEALGLNSTAEE